LASDLFPADVEALRRDSEFAASYRETPRLSTYYAAFNIHRGPLTDAALRLRIIKAVEVAALVQRTLRRVAIPAEGLIPPGLLGHDPAGGVREPTTLVPVSSGEVKLVAAVHPVFTREYAAFYDRFSEALKHVGIRLELSQEAMGDLLATKRQAEVDLALVQWVADYPDADSFVNILQTDAGFIGPLCGSPEIDDLIERGRSETDPDLRHSIYRRVEETIMREARLLPLFHEQVYRFARPEIEGLSVSYLSPAVAYDEIGIRGL
jgi:ABC-type oligopeptide transport system substrate-binding subunit